MDILFTSLLGFFIIGFLDSPLAGIVLVLIFWGIFMVGGTSPGKAILNMRVIKKDTKETVGFWIMLLRETIGKAISGFVFSLGYIWILIDDNHQGWHDKLVNTIVVMNK